MASGWSEEMDRKAEWMARDPEGYFSAMRLEHKRDRRRVFVCGFLRGLTFARQPHYRWCPMSRWDA